MNLYRQNIIDNYKNPRNFGEMKDSDKSRMEFNNTCGDSIMVYLKIRGEKMEDVRFKGQGCAISISAMSLLSEKIKGMAIEDVLKIGEKEINELLGVEINPGRKKCALLGITAVKNAISSV